MSFLLKRCSLSTKNDQTQKTWTSTHPHSRCLA